MANATPSREHGLATVKVREPVRVGLWAGSVPSGWELVRVDPDPVARFEGEGAVWPRSVNAVWDAASAGRSSA